MSSATENIKYLPLKTILGVLDWVDKVEFRESKKFEKKYVCVMHAQGKPYCTVVRQQGQSEDDIRMFAAEACLNLVRQLEEKGGRKKAFEISFVLNRERSLS